MLLKIENCTEPIFNAELMRTRRHCYCAAATNTLRTFA